MTAVFSVTFSLHSIRSFHVGGHNATVSGMPTQSRRLAQHAMPRPVDPNGDHETGQMYVQLYTQTAPVCPWPIVLWHGGGMTGTNWETTPDGRAGWLECLLAAGFNVAVCDAVERGRAGWNPFPAIYDSEPIFRSKQEGWDLFRFGRPQDYAGRLPFAAQRFPVDHLDQFAKQWVPRWADHETQTMAAYRALLTQIGPAIVIGHSQGGGFALQAAMQCPDLVRAVIALEPSGAPDVRPANDTPHPPHLILWGDYIQEHAVWRAYRARVDAYCQTLAQQNAAPQVIDLPAQGIYGNSHFLMMDDNSHALATQVIQWIATTTGMPDRHPARHTTLSQP